MASKHETCAVAHPETDATETSVGWPALHVVPGSSKDSGTVEAPRSDAAAAQNSLPVGLVAAHALSWDAETGTAILVIGGRELEARLATEVDPIVIRRAIERREHVIAQPEGSDWLVLGVLRTSATPGIDVGDDYTIEARRVRIKAEHELTLTAGMARIALASLGRIESIAHFITSRASAVHKIIGRAIEMN